MKFYQPMLYVGLGGTGCQVGIELERRLRDELCGPDGLKLRRDEGIEELLPHELPGFAQFIYADLNEAELARVREKVSVTEDRALAAGMTNHYAQNLVPKLMTYPEVARSLRANAPAQVLDWLPPPTGEPRVSPLVRGAGQLPTVGRAALFETFRHGVDSMTAPLNTALAKIAGSRPLLSRLGARRPTDTCNVFVCFSLAGGTGTGIYYDALHLIGQQFATARMSPQIYPLVLMPSAFDEGFGGGRRAELNAATALLDLCRLIDDQNARGADEHLRDSRRPILFVPEVRNLTVLEGTPGFPEERTQEETVSVTYPNIGRVQLPSSTVQTAFLFSKGVSIAKEDLHRSMVSFVLSLVGTELDTQAEVEHASEQLYQSFADSFINEGVDRQNPAATGVGKQPVSTSLVASMTVPVDELADIISSRILARAIDEYAAPALGGSEVNRPEIERFFASSALDELRQRAPEPFHEPAPARGATAIGAALRKRGGAMESRLRDLPNRLSGRAPELARDFNYRRGLAQALGRLDPFRVRRIVVGNPQATETAERVGFIGSLEARCEAPAPPDQNMTAQPPAVPDLRRFLHRVAWTDAEVQNVLRTQSSWYGWRTRVVWHAAWGKAAPVWDGRVRRLRKEIIDFTDAFLDHAREEAKAYDQRTADLYRPRVGVSYLLPKRGDFENFYASVVRRFTSVSALALREHATEAEIVSALLGESGWQQIFEQAVDGKAERRYEHAVAAIRDLIKSRVQTLFTNRGPYGDDQPLLPQMRNLLARAAGRDTVSVAESDVAAFEGSLSGLLPIAYVPEGTGQLKILVTYPADAKDPLVERYIEETIALPREAGAHKEFRAVSTESVMVVLLRTSMGITEVPEIRTILSRWSDALVRDNPQDFMRWRQRLGYDYRWAATTESDRVKILHHILCAMWNGQIGVYGDRESPIGIAVQLPEGQRLRMELRLDRFGAASSWSTLLRAYEDWTFAESGQINQDFCKQLMRTRPVGLSQGGSRPSPLYSWFLDDLAPQQIALLDTMARTATVDNGRWIENLRDFWASTLPAACGMAFEGALPTHAPNLRQLRGDDDLRQLRGEGDLRQLRGDTDTATGDEWDPEDGS
jgi:hypothetical protein